MIYSLDEIDKMSKEEYQQKVRDVIKEKLKEDITCLDLSIAGLEKYKLLDSYKEVVDKDVIKNTEEVVWYNFYLYSPVNKNSKCGQIIFEYEITDKEKISPEDLISNYTDKYSIGCLRVGLTQMIFFPFMGNCILQQNKCRFKNYKEFEKTTANIQPIYNKTRVCL